MLEHFLNLNLKIAESEQNGEPVRASIFVEGDTYDEMKVNIRIAVHRHFEEESPKIISAHFTKEEVFAA